LSYQEEVEKVERLEKLATEKHSELKSYHKVLQNLYRLKDYLEVQEIKRQDCLKQELEISELLKSSLKQKYLYNEQKIQKMEREIKQAQDTLEQT
jgi:hypothetical protein